ncbi:aminodeoxychorismate/anthranilate synthase component II [Fulvitalea axinellae]|uniref:Aminodeoxychorismate/anthranilate synthase component II n=1 Tax=Fulvitalea axinellae TaxID=1182444 RepID=A0AAU9DFS2_9BACT|nr:aminodeoxychorismate/anthranilate synthase component II [Fulvitalea axinellae]
MRILVIDNYDSFTYNLVHLIRELGYGEQMDVIRNDKISVEAVAEYDKILISPGPGVPEDAGITKDVIKTYGPSKSILGVCLGHQAIAEVYGAELYNMPEVLHGVDTDIKILENDGLFEEVKEVTRVCRYHSWAVKPETLKTPLKLTAEDETGVVMGLRHDSYDVQGVQFHPESILTPEGKTMIKNWLESGIKS